MTKKAVVKKVAGKEISLPKADQVRKDLLDMRKSIEDNYLALAKMMSEVRTNEYHRDYGFKNFSDYAEEELRIHNRRARFFADIGDMIKQYKLEDVDMKAIGWTKASVLLSYIDEDNKKKLVDIAKTSSVRDLKDDLKKLAAEKSGGTFTSPPTSHFTLHLKMDPAEADVITSAIEAASSAMDVDNKVTALEFICQEWMQENMDADPASVESLIAYAKKVFGVTLGEVIDTEPEPEVIDISGQKEKQAEKPKTKEEKEDPLSLLKTKKALREYIKEKALGVKIARGQKISDIKDSIRDAEATPKQEEKPTPEATDIDDILGDGPETEVPPEVMAVTEPPEEDINDILGIV